MSSLPAAAQNDRPAKNVTQVTNDVAAFLQWLEQQRISKDGADADFFAKLNEIVGAIKQPLPTLFNPPSIFNSAVFFHLSEIKNSMIFTYQFE